MSQSLTIGSANDATRLTFSDVDGESFCAALESAAFAGRVLASTYFSGPPSLLFSEMAANWRGWAGVKEWAALDDDLRLSATADRTGHIALEVTMRACGTAADWQLVATLHLEAGQLESLSRGMSDLFVHLRAA
jgi:hypothetical protein